MSEKDPEAFRTIGEVAEELDLPQHVLRFWETKFSQIRPTKRSSGRRFYRPEDVALVRAIRDMLYGQGYTIRGVQKLLKEQGAREFTRAPAPAPYDDAVKPVATDIEEGSSDMPTRVAVASSADLYALREELLLCARLLADARE